MHDMETPQYNIDYKLKFGLEEMTMTRKSWLNGRGKGCD